MCTTGIRLPITITPCQVVVYCHFIVGSINQPIYLVIILVHSGSTIIHELLYRDNNRIVINLVCNNRHRQYNNIINILYRTSLKQNIVM